jgi:hypothetical protein
MKPLYRLLLLISLLTLAACANSDSDSGPGGSEALRSGPFKLLIYSRTAGFRHA